MDVEFREGRTVKDNLTENRRVEHVDTKWMFGGKKRNGRKGISELLERRAGV